MTEPPEPPDLSGAGLPLGPPAARGGLRSSGLAGVLVGLVLALLALPGPGVLLPGVLALQVLVALALLVSLALPGRLGGLAVAGAAAVAAGTAAVLGDGGVAGLAGVAALGLVVALLHQLARRSRRTAVTSSLSGTVTAVVLVVAAACLLALAADPGTGDPGDPGGSRVASAALAAAAGALLAARLLDPRAPVSGRGPARLVLGLAAGALGAALAGAGAVPFVPGLLLGLVSGAAALLGERAAAVADEAPPLPRVVFPARGLLAALLPYAVLGPVALLAGRLVLG